MTSSQTPGQDPKSVKGQDWFEDGRLQRLFDILNVEGGEVRVAGGAVRNALMGFAVADVDLATTWTPDEVDEKASAAKLKVIPTGKDHGTMTVVVNGTAFEITSLREDIKTDGRHAVVKFGTDWQKDAERRDLTINGLYANANGDVIDLVGGIEDIKTSTVRFIGDAETRIREDYLRVLRFFRFFAHYGQGRPDAAGLKASAKAVSHIDHLSAERVWKELKLLLSASDPTRALLWMRTTGILTALLPETEKWGIDSIGPLVDTQQTLGWTPDPLLTLMAIIPPDVERLSAMCERLKMSRVETRRIQDWAKSDAIAQDIAQDMAETKLDRLLYMGSESGILDRLKLALISARSRAHGDENAMQEAAYLAKLIKRGENFTKPEFPVTGQDLIAQGVEPGKDMGVKLLKLEALWVESNFTTSKSDLLEQL